MKSRTIPTITLSEARQIALRAQGLADDAAPFGSGKAAVLRAVEHLGYVQIDTISVVQRAHHHVLWSRVPDYQPEMLHQLHEQEASIFEYWSHAAAYLPMRDYRFSLPLMHRFRKELHWSDESPELKRAMRRMITRIRSKGPLLLRDVESKARVAGWGGEIQSKIEKRALHELWMRGQIMIRSRSGFQRVFDLPERVLPPGLDTSRPTERETALFHVRKTLKALGLARLPELHYLQKGDRTSEVRRAVRDLLERGDVVELRVEGSDLPCCALPEFLSFSAAQKQGRVRILSPFDNLVIQRDRLRWLFGFDYTIECYVPAAKRRYGYFVLPILFGDRFVARMDAKADRAKRTLIIHRLVVEPWFEDLASFREPMRDALKAFASFQQCERWVLVDGSPSQLRKVLGKTT